MSNLDGRYWGAFNFFSHAILYFELILSPLAMKRNTMYVYIHSACQWAFGHFPFGAIINSNLNILQRAYDFR